MDWKELLDISAGPAALARLSDAGLKPEDISVFAGPATGPRWIVFAGIDRALADSRWLNRGKGIWLWGASAGAWRFASLAQKDPSSAIRLFQETYASMRFDLPVNPGQVREELERAMKTILPKSAGERESLIKGAQGLKLAVVTVRQKQWAQGMERFIYGTTLLLNFFHHSANELLLDRVVFHTPPVPPAQIKEKGFPGEAHPLTLRNMEKVLLATGCVPFKVVPPDCIPDAPAGIYQDGGFLDYHINTCLFPCNDEGLILLITHPGRPLARWMDRFTPWRRLPKELFDRLVIIQPSEKLLDLLPGRKVPSRQDWTDIKDHNERLDLWNKALEAALPLGDVFMEAIESGSIRKMVVPMGG